MPFPQLTPPDRRVAAGVCGGIGDAIGVDPTLVRLVFGLLALAGGAGIVLYVAAWFAMSGRRREKPWAPLLLVVIAASLALGALGGALLLVAGPWLWQLGLERDAERTARIRTEERAEVAARVHDSVLQTLALIQRHSAEPRRVASLARRQERELRGWLYGDGATDAATLAGALTAAAEEVEELHGVRVELARGGDCPLGEELRPLVLAAREAMANAAKFSGADEIAVYADCDDDRVSVFVRDRGAGFDRARIPADRRGLAESI